MSRFSILDLSTVGEGQTVRDALDNTRHMAVKAEEVGYNRYWLAEHHGMRGVASAATSVVLGHVGAATKKIRIGSGGVMLPNHAPYVIAEQFGTLEALFPGRVDLGLGRAPGTDMATARALRRDLDAAANRFPDDIQELQAWLDDAQAGQRVIAFPGVGSHVPLWILGSSLYSAHLAAALGLPYAFASHFAPDMLLEALSIYRARFQPSAQLDQPYVMVGTMGVIADTDEEAAYYFTSAQQQFINLRRGAPGPFPKPVESMDGLWNEMEKNGVEHTLRYAAVGTRGNVDEKLRGFLEETGADEVIVSFPIYDLDARLKAVDAFSRLSVFEAAGH
ncbi:LLM class flavin-dependent oxidoreductase [Rhizobium sp. L1K21]|uniref:LLM class flavin-dependent oxidoreductase n=1 Tax=Rhizobium sp. L1K21 TaxID=2954933 RepID=UPI002092F8D8|nr:LLM class flavin-dependent oxidoreductase [Rhizobium sp. L1K21]MCO6185070.1 LLM class flavin-dependent oxidoreductase [Rhizobium sp. L1K21]